MQLKIQKLHMSQECFVLVYFRTQKLKNGNKGGRISKYIFDIFYLKKVLNFKYKRKQFFSLKVSLEKATTDLSFS